MIFFSWVIVSVSAEQFVSCGATDSSCSLCPFSLAQRMSASEGINSSVLPEAPLFACSSLSLPGAHDR